MPIDGSKTELDAFKITAMPEQLGDYLVNRQVKAGPTACLFQGKSIDTDQEVCLKWFPAQDSAGAPALHAVLENAQAAQFLDHANIVPVFDVTEAQGHPLIVSEWNTGDDLSTILGQQGPFRPGAAIAFLHQVVSGLSYMHEQDITHGDLRPGHLLMDHGRVRILSFGQTPQKQTNSGRVIKGHAAYSAPEVIYGKATDFRTDVYALACTFFELLVGRAPFGTTPEDAILACHAHEPFPSAKPLCPHIPPTLDALLRKMGSKDPARRTQSYAELLQRTQFLSQLDSSGVEQHPVLTVEIGRQRGMIVDIPEGNFLLGRNPGIGFVIDDGRISRRHSMITRTGSEVVIKDLGSRNGTKVNGLSIEFAPIKSGDRIFIGDTVLRVDGCEPRPKNERLAETEDSSQAKPKNSSPLRGALGGSEISHSPEKQKSFVADRVKEEENPMMRAMMRLAAAQVKSCHFHRLKRHSLAPLEPMMEAEGSWFVPHEDNGLRFEASSAADAQFLSHILPALTRATPGQLALATTVQVDRSEHSHVLLAPIWGDSSPIGYLVFMRSEKPFQEEDLIALELIADLLAKPAEEVTIV